MARRKRLFPQEFNWMPYSWLVYWLISLVYMFYGATSRRDLLIGLALMISFLVIYRETFWSRGQKLVGLVLLEVIIIGTLVGIFGVGFLFLGSYPSSICGVMFPRRRMIASVLVIMALLTIPVVITHVVSWHFLLDSGLVVAYLTVMLSALFARGSRRWREVMEELRLANQQIEQLTKEAERQRIARDLHDTLGHTLSMITLKSELAEKLVDRNAARAVQEMRDVQDASRTALTQVRELISNLHSISITEEVAKVRRILDAADIRLVEPDLTAEASQASLRSTILAMCLREATNNVVKHSRATLCRVDLIETDADTTLVVIDNGLGINASGTDRQNDRLSSGHGLKGMRQRVELVGGRMDIRANAPRGTVVIAVIPRIMSGTSGRGQNS